MRKNIKLFVLWSQGVCARQICLQSTGGRGWGVAVMGVARGDRGTRGKHLSQQCWRQMQSSQKMLIFDFPQISGTQAERERQKHMELAAVLPLCLLSIPLNTNPKLAAFASLS